MVNFIGADVFYRLGVRKVTAYTDKVKKSES